MDKLVVQVKLYEMPDNDIAQGLEEFAKDIKSGNSYPVEVAELLLKESAHRILTHRSVDNEGNQRYLVVPL